MDSIKGLAIGFIGLGLMGKPMSRNLQKAGASLVIHNRSRAPVDALVQEGMSAALTPRDVAQRSEVVILMTTDTPAVEQVLLGADGVLEGLQPGQLIIDMGSSEVFATRRFAQRITEAGGDYLDAPVSGGEVGAVQASLAIMVGGMEAAFERARPIFEVLGRNITHVGASGAGQVAKLANQLIVGVTIGAVAEALALAQHAGIDKAKLRQALMGGFAQSRILEVHGQRMVDGVFKPGARATTQRKDISQGMDLARSLDLPLPFLELAGRRFDELIAQGHGAVDHSGLFKLYE